LFVSLYVPLFLSLFLCLIVCLFIHCLSCIRFIKPQKGERKCLPDMVKELLEDPNILKVSCSILNDRTKLMADYNLDLPKDVFINISTLAVKRKLLT
jgi:hypothetical protein